MSMFESVEMDGRFVKSIQFDIPSTDVRVTLPSVTP